MEHRKITAVACGDCGKKALAAAQEILVANGSALDAVERGVNAVEQDPESSCAGLGAWPNAAGVVECEAAIMEGAGHRAGAVSGLKEIERPVSVARAVMEKSEHTILNDAGALAFAMRQGFKRKRLLTRESRAAWVNWYKDKRRGELPEERLTATLALDNKQEIAAACSSGGLAFRSSGRQGVAPLIGGGIYVDNAVGAAAVTGASDLLMLFAPSFLVVELMMDELSPQDACETALERIKEMRPEIAERPVGLIALDRKGAFGGATTAGKFSYAVWRMGDKEAEVFTIRQI